MKIGIVGAGAIGGLIGVRLAGRNHEVGVLARGTTLESLRSGAWKLEFAGASFETRVNATARAAELGPQDIVIVAVKGPALAAVAGEIGPMLGPETVVIPAMNGVPWWFLLAGGVTWPPTQLKSVDPHGAIARTIPFERVIGCVVHASAFVSSPGCVVHQAGNKLIFGEPNGQRSGRVRDIARVFQEAGFETDESQNIRRDIWYKLWGNMTMNPISAITRANSDVILADDLVRGFMLAVMEEAREIGQRIGCTITESGEARMGVARRLGSFKTSMLQDAEAGRPLEIDSLIAAPREIAALVGAPTPNLDTLLGLARLYARMHGL